MTSAIALQNVTKIYRRSHLGRVQESIGVSKLTLEIRTGEVFGLLGLNGSGKTTTLKILLGLLRPTQGTALLFGSVMPEPAVLRKIGYLPDAAYLPKYLTGQEALWYYATLSGIPREKRRAAVDLILDKVGMTAAAHKRIGEYSKGMLQRISIAQALVHNPELLIMDEPITGLDPLAVREMRELVGWLKAQGRTVFFSSHDISEVEKVCDRIGILAAGELVAVMDQKDWAATEGKLESVFTATVKRPEGIGSLKFS
jgi:ABC-2 type transport system ATP-binding protein